MAVQATVLIVDDLPEIRRMVHRMLERDDRFAAVDVRDGLEAIRVVEQVAPDVVILDLAMPMFDGQTALTRIQELSPKSKIVVLSGHTDRKEEVLALGADAFLPKTVGPETLTKTLAEVLGLET